MTTLVKDYMRPVTVVFLICLPLSLVSGVIQYGWAGLLLGPLFGFGLSLLVIAAVAWVLFVLERMDPDE